MTPVRCGLAIALCALLLPGTQPAAQVPTQDTPPPRQTQRPPLHGTQWMALTGKPLGAAAGAMIFQQGGNAIDAACAMLAAVSTGCTTMTAHRA